MNVKVTAFCTVTVLGAATIGAAFAAATAASTATTVAFAALALIGAGLGIASVTAYPVSNNSREYLNNVKNHAGYAIAAIFQFTAQTLIAGLVQGLADGIRTLIFDKVTGNQKQPA
ncbi:MAG TPA: hypothetical protein VLF61_02185 [Rhabdochlamydiaceae bacterium]|nr:hypothetical protein [Rhabdochlamydiaceae bacterium]